MNYIAYTIGPIYDTIFDTLNGVNKTKKLYAGSYFFSYFMKLLLKNIKDNFDVIVPYIDGDVLETDYNMGLFHDRFIATCKNHSKEEAKEIFTQKVDITFKAIAKEIESENIAETLKQNMDNHFIVFSDDELKSVNENIIFAINHILDSKELQRDFKFNIEKNNYIQKYQEKFVNDKKKKKVKTLEDISGDINYYAVITADGDKMGQKIKNEATKNPSEIKSISKKLFEFFTDKDDIYEITNNHFGGELIYAGGDDILAFVPVKYNDKTFLDYIKVLDDRFKDKVGDDVSLSFGVNIAFVKYPLRDAIKSAFDLLYSAKANHSNSIAIKVTKHSGQYFNSIFNIQSEQYRKYKELVDDILTQKATLPHSLHHSLKGYEEAIISTYKNDRTIDAMFDTVFNDEKTKKNKQGMNDIKEYINSCKPKSNNEFDDLFSALSIIKFLREDRKEKKQDEISTNI